MKIGITERGDASLDLSWQDKIDSVDGAIIISKGYNEQFENALLKQKNKVIYHCTCTGLGGTCLEPNISNYEIHLNKIYSLLEKGFPVDHIVLRIDPIIDLYYGNSILDNKYIDRIWSIIEGFVVPLGIKRIRYSFIDLYNHVKYRIIETTKCEMHTGEFSVREEDQRIFFDIFKQLKTLYPFLQFESCAEVFAPTEHQVGCVSVQDFKILGLDLNQCYGLSKQRMHCLCCAQKIELLTNRSQCPFKCAYCYWK